MTIQERAEAGAPASAEESHAGGDTTGASAEGTQAEAVPAAEARGETEIAERVLERIAGYAITEVDQAGGYARRVLGVPLGQDSTRSAPQVSAQIDGGLATLQMTISVVYPTPVPRVARKLRERVTTRVEELTGLDVRQVDISVANLIRPPRREGRVR